MTWHFPLTKSVSFTPPFFEVKELLIFKSSYFRDSLATLRDLTSPVNYRFLLSFPYVLHFCVCMYACMFASVWAGTYTYRVCAGRGQRLTLGVFLNHSTPYPARQGLSLECMHLPSIISHFALGISCLCSSVRGLWGGHHACLTVFTWVSKICSSCLYGHHLYCFFSPTLYFLEGDLKPVGVRIERYGEDNGGLVGFQLDLFRPF